jgi:hypothetical protein
MTRALNEGLKQAADISLLAHNNLLINGFMGINQEYAVGTGVLSGKFPADMWCINTPLAGASAGQVGTPFPSQPDITMALKFTAPAAQAVSANDISQIYHNIEGINLAKLMYGTSTARPLTVAFMLRASYTGVASFSLVNLLNNPTTFRSYVHRLSFVANQDTFFCFTIPGDQVWALLSTGVGSLQARWCFEAGANFQTSSLDTWVAGNLIAPPDISNVGAVAGQNISIGGCVLVPGRFAITQDVLPLLARRYEDDLRLCQRYFALVYGGARFAMPGYTAFTESTMYMPVPMRTLPTAVLAVAGGSQNMSGGYPMITPVSSTHSRFIISGSAGNTDSYALNYLYAFNARM